MDFDTMFPAPMAQLTRFACALTISRLVGVCVTCGPSSAPTGDQIWQMGRRCS